MLAAELSTDLREAVTGHLFAEIHRNLTRHRDGPGVVLGFHFLDRKAVVSSNAAGDPLHSQPCRTLSIEDVLHRLLCEGLRDRNTFHGRYCYQPYERTF